MGSCHGSHAGRSVSRNGQLTNGQISFHEGSTIGRSGVRAGQRTGRPHGSGSRRGPPAACLERAGAICPYASGPGPVSPGNRQRRDGARLNGARLNGARLNGARLNGARPDGVRPDGVRRQRARRRRGTAGPRSRSPAAGRRTSSACCFPPWWCRVPRAIAHREERTGHPGRE
ncbi:pentapeptide repeat-containing protein [Kitasatospora purpeofusca]|uniref:pentapeptide repeat-containing protein n=1 Tax=Kitasatospora purpeofusca TaxID=67352 RepID=UPI003BF460B2